MKHGSPCGFKRKGVKHLPFEAEGADRVCARIVIPKGNPIKHAEFPPGIEHDFNGKSQIMN
jgi:hypothetical protein